MPQHCAFFIEMRQSVASGTSSTQILYRTRRVRTTGGKNFDASTADQRHANGQRTLSRVGAQAAGARARDSISRCAARGIGPCLTVRAQGRQPGFANRGRLNPIPLSNAWRNPFCCVAGRSSHDSLSTDAKRISSRVWRRGRRNCRRQRRSHVRAEDPYFCWDRVRAVG